MSIVYETATAVSSAPVAQSGGYGSHRSLTDQVSGMSVDWSSVSDSRLQRATSAQLPCGTHAHGVRKNATSDICCGVANEARPEGGYVWLRRFRDSTHALEDRSRRPHTTPMAIPEPMQDTMQCALGRALRRDPARPHRPGSYGKRVVLASRA